MSEEENEDRRKSAVVVGGAERDKPGEKEIDWQAVYEQQQNEIDTPHPFLDNQIAKIGCGCVAPLFFGFGALSGAGATAFAVAGTGELLGYLFGYAFSGIIFIWLPLFLFWLRDQSRWLIGGSFIGMMAILMLVGLGHIGSATGNIQKDAAAVANIKIGEDGLPIIPEGMEQNGPMSKLIFGLVQKQMAINNEFENDFARLGADDLGTADKLEANPIILSRCGMLLDMKPKIEAYRTRTKANLINVEDQIDAMDVSPGMREAMKAGFRNSRPDSIRRADIQWDAQSASIERLHDMCLILKKRQWKAAGVAFEFSSQADMNSYNMAVTELNRQAQIFEESRAEGISKMQSGQQMIRRNLEIQ